MSAYCPNCGPISWADVNRYGAHKACGHSVIDRVDRKPKRDTAAHARAAALREALKVAQGYGSNAAAMAIAEDIRRLMVTPQANSNTADVIVHPGEPGPGREETPRA